MHDTLVGSTKRRFMRDNNEENKQGAFSGIYSGGLIESFKKICYIALQGKTNASYIQTIPVAVCL